MTVSYNIVPPSFIQKETSTDMVVRESSNVTLTCKATGYPEPYVMWQREDGQNIYYNKENGKWQIYNKINNVNNEIYILLKFCIIYIKIYFDLLSKIFLIIYDLLIH